MKASIQSKILAWFLKAFNFKKIVEKKAFKEIPRSRKGFVPRSIKRRYLINPDIFNDNEIATFEKKERVTKNHIIFFHGGAYIFEASPSHWRLAKQIVNNSFCRMTLIDYPLASEHNYQETFTAISGAYEKLTNHYPGDNFILMGDSAGGGLALAFAQKLIKEIHQKLPAKIVLLSPWLDLTMSNPDIKNQESLDYILTVKMLKHAATKYSNGYNPIQYLLSPIHSDFKEIPETLIFCGTEELFYPDCIKLKSMIVSDNPGIMFREYRKMQHDWAIFPIPESKQVVNEICQFIKD